MKTSLDPRHLKRRKIVQDLFAWEAKRKLTNLPISKSANPLSQEKSKKIAENIEAIDKIIKEAAPEWGIEKINQPDLAVLRLSIFELCFELTEPPKVIVDEAVELAKEFGSENSPSFVNGALGKVLISKTRLLKVIAAKLGVEEERLAPEANLRSDLNATDLEIADLISILEQELNLQPPLHLEQLKTVGDIFEYIEDHNE